MGAMQPWHLLVLLFIVALVVSIVVLVVLLLARGAARRPPMSAPRSAQPTLTELAALHARGDLTDEEFAAAKRKSLDL